MALKYILGYEDEFSGNRSLQMDTVNTMDISLIKVNFVIKLVTKERLYLELEKGFLTSLKLDNEREHEVFDTHKSV